jgi:hypothetical protein
MGLSMSSISLASDVGGGLGSLESSGSFGGRVMPALESYCEKSNSIKKGGGSDVIGTLRLKSCVASMIECSSSIVSYDLTNTYDSYEVIWNDHLVDIGYETLTFNSVVDSAKKLEEQGTITPPPPSMWTGGNGDGWLDLKGTSGGSGLPSKLEKSTIGSTGLEDNTAGSSGLGSLAKKCGL